MNGGISCPYSNHRIRLVVSDDLRNVGPLAINCPLPGCPGRGRQVTFEYADVQRRDLTPIMFAFAGAILGAMVAGPRGMVYGAALAGGGTWAVKNLPKLDSHGDKQLT